MKGFIYKVTNKQNGKIYIGQTSRTIEERWREHTTNATHDNNLEYKNKFHRAIRKYGSGGFIVEEQEKIIARNEDDLHRKLNDAETKWILHYDSKDNGYNSSLGGDYNPMYGVRGKDNPCSVKINQYDLDGHFIKTWDSLADIAREFGNQGNIIKVCKSNRLKTRKVTAFKYVWRYYSEFPDCNDIVISEEELKIRDAKGKDANGNPLVGRSKEISQYELNGNFIKSFSSAKEAAEAIGGTREGLSKAMHRKTDPGVYKGYLWKFK